MTALASRQHGIVSRRQLAASGVVASAIDRWVAAGLLVPVHRGVYLVGTDLISRHGIWYAATAAAGPDSALSHRSAGCLRGVHALDAPWPEVSLTDRAGSARPRLIVHRPRTLTVEDIETVDGIRVTTVPRTLADLADVVGLRDLERAVDEALRLDLTTLEEVAAHLRPGRRGSRRLRRVLARADHGTTATRSRPEEQLLAIVRAAGLPEPHMNAEVAGREWDAVWARQRIAVEVDGGPWHALTPDREDDAAKAAAARAAGWATDRFTDREVDEEPERVLARLAALGLAPAARGLAPATPGRASAAPGRAPAAPGLAPAGRAPSATPRDRTPATAAAPAPSHA